MHGVVAEVGLGTDVYLLTEVGLHAMSYLIVSPLQRIEHQSNAPLARDGLGIDIVASLVTAVMISWPAILRTGGVIIRARHFVCDFVWKWLTIAK